MTATVPLLIKQGATFTRAFVWCRESDPPTTPPTAGVPYDLTGAVATMQIRKTAKSPALISASSAPGVVGSTPMITLGGTTGRVAIKLDGTTTSLLAVTAALYDIKVVLANGDIHYPIEGPVEVDPDITRDTP